MTYRTTHISQLKVPMVWAVLNKHRMKVVYRNRKWWLTITSN